MFCLPQEVSRTDLSVYGFICDDEGLGWPGDQVDADASEKLTLGLGYKGIARTYDHRDRSDRFGAECHGGDCLHAAHTVDFVRSAKVHRGYHGRAWLAMIWRGRRDHSRHARDSCRHYAHMCGGNQRIFPSGDVTADGINRHVFVAENDARQCFDFNVLYRRPLRLGEVAHLRLSELNVVDGLRGKLGETIFNLLLGQAKSGRVPFVELLGDFAQSSFAATLNIFDNASYDVADLLGIGRGLFRRPSSLQISCHLALLSEFARPASYPTAETGSLSSTSLADRRCCSAA